MVEKNDSWGSRKCFSFFLFEFGLIVPAVLKCLFSHLICTDVVSLIFAPVKDFLDVYNVEHPSQM